eukprot:scpid80621/ scgid2972/ 
MDSPDARRLRQARREARKRNINQNAADRLRRIQGVQSSGATVTRPEVENRESQEANSGDISVTRPGSSETANTNVDEASAAGAGLIEETQRNDNDRRIPEGGLAATGATADGSEDGSILKRRIVRKPDTNDESQSLEKQHESMAIKSSSAEIGQAEQSSSRHAAEASGAAGTEKDKSSTSSSLASQSQSSENNAAKQDKAVGQQAQVLSGPWLVLLTVSTILCAVLNVASRISFASMSAEFQAYWEQGVVISLNVFCAWLAYLIPQLLLRSYRRHKSRAAPPPTVATPVSAELAALTSMVSGGGGGDGNAARAVTSALVSGLLPAPARRAIVYVGWLLSWYQPVVLQFSIYVITLIALFQIASHFDLVKSSS